MDNAGPDLGQDIPSTDQSVSPILRVERLRKTFSIVELERIFSLQPSQVFRSVEAVRNVNLSVFPGEVFGFLGPNGAGKTTTIKMCMDLIEPTDGKIQLFGRTPRDRLAKEKVGYLPEHPYFYDYLKPQEILDYFGRVFGIPRREREKRIAALLDRVGLNHARNRPLRKFSKGMLQRLGIAQALINEPKLLVLDEPLSGLDPMGRKEIRDIIIEQRSKGTTIFFSSHILSDIEYLCDRVAIVHHGEIVREGVLEMLLSSEKRQSELVIRGNSDALKFLGFAVTDLGSASRVVLDSDQLRNAVNAVHDAGGVIESVQPHRDSLEDLFVRATGGGES